MDACFPGKVNLSRVNFNAYLPHEVTQNYKILQKTFASCGVQKYVDAEVLSRGRFIENLEFLQWLKCYYETNGSSVRPSDYHARERRRHFGIADPKQSASSAVTATPSSRKDGSTPSRTALKNTSLLSSAKPVTLKRALRTPVTTKTRVLHFAPSPAPPPSAAASTTTATQATTSQEGGDHEEEPAEKRARRPPAVPSSSPAEQQQQKREAMSWEVQGLLGALRDAERRASELEERIRNAENVCKEVIADKVVFSETEDPVKSVAGMVLDSLFPQTY